MKMVSFKENYEVIIVGGDHHNGLGLARIFGINKVKVHSFVISENLKSFLAKSPFYASSSANFVASSFLHKE